MHDIANPGQYKKNCSAECITWRKCQIIHFFVILDMSLLFKMTAKIFFFHNHSANISQVIYFVQNLKYSLVLFCTNNFGIHIGSILGFLLLLFPYMFIVWKIFRHFQMISLSKTFCWLERSLVIVKLLCKIQSLNYISKWEHIRNMTIFLLHWYSYVSIRKKWNKIWYSVFCSLWSIMLHFETCPNIFSDTANFESHICDCWQKKVQNFSSLCIGRP